MINLGRHTTSRERVVRALWMLAVRASAPGAVRPGVGLKTPATQRLIVEATGLPRIHVDRVIQRLRDQRIVELHDGVMFLENPRVLSTIANALVFPRSNLTPGLSGESVRTLGMPA